MEDIYRRDNYKKSYKGTSNNANPVKKRPGRKTLLRTNEPPVNCFVCDEKILKQKVNLVQGPSRNKNGFASQISQLLGDEFLIIVQEEDYICKQCVLLFNSMEKLEKQLSSVKVTLLKYLKAKYNLSNSSSAAAITSSASASLPTKELNDSLKNDDIAKKLNELHTGKQIKLEKIKEEFDNSGSSFAKQSKNSSLLLSKLVTQGGKLKCSICSYGTTQQSEYDNHLHKHITTAMETELNENSNSMSNDGSCFNSSSVSVKIFRCSICLKTYITKEKCLEHLNKSHAVDFNNISNKSVVTKSNKRKRKVKKFYMKNGLYCCNYCFTSFNQSVEFDKHNCNDYVSDPDEKISENESSDEDITEGKSKTKRPCSSMSDFNLSNIESFTILSKKKELNNELVKFYHKINESSNKVDTNNEDSFKISENKMKLENIKENVKEKISPKPSNTNSNDNSNTSKEIGDETKLEKNVKSEIPKEKSAENKLYDKLKTGDTEKVDVNNKDIMEEDDDDEEEEEENDGDDSLDEDDDDDFDEDDSETDEEITKQHVCGNCGYKGDLISLREHLTEERPQRDLICSVCGQSFNSFCKFIQHSSGHDINAIPIVCIYCNNKVPDLLSLNYHMKKNHLNLIDPKMCEICKQVLPNSDFLSVHVNSNCGTENIMVDNCEEVSNTDNGRNLDLPLLDTNVDESQISTENIIALTGNLSDIQVGLHESYVTGDTVSLDRFSRNFVTSHELTKNTVINQLPENLDSYELSRNAEETCRIPENSEDVYVLPGEPDEDLTERPVISYELSEKVSGVHNLPENSISLPVVTENTADSQGLIVGLPDSTLIDTHHTMSHTINKHSSSNEVFGVVDPVNEDVSHEMTFNFEKNNIQTDMETLTDSSRVDNCDIKLENQSKTINRTSKSDIMVHITPDEFSENSVIVYKCGVCGEQRNSEEELLKHFEKHLINQCDNSKQGDNVLVENENKVSGNNNNSNIIDNYCNMCEISYLSDTNNFLSHQSKHNLENQNILCIYCNNKYHDNLTLKYHIIKYHMNNIKTLFCQLCKIQFNRVFDFKRHNIEHKIIMDGNVYYCKKCNLTFPTRIKFITHCYREHKIDYSCKYCIDLNFKDVNELNNHKRIFHLKRNHVGAFKFNFIKCQLCKQEFKDKFSYEFHNLKHSVDLLMPHCIICELSFNSYKVLDEHINKFHLDELTRENKFLYDCKECNRTFIHFNKFRIHKLKHENINNLFHCKMCSKTFNNFSLYFLHKRNLHNDNYFSFNCNICNNYRNCRNFNLYKRHMLSHIKRYKYNCKICLKYFSNENNFKKHNLRVHKKKINLKRSFKTVSVVRR